MSKFSFQNSSHSVWEGEGKKEEEEKKKEEKNMDFMDWTLKELVSKSQSYTYVSVVLAGTQNQCDEESC